MKKIEVCQMRAGDIKTGFGNPRKVTKKKLEELWKSMERLGDFGVYLIDEEDNIIGGNQRLKVVLEHLGPDTMLDCKRLIGYSNSELRAINVKDNTHSGEWDLDALADWTVDLDGEFSLPEFKDDDLGERKVKMMELVRYEGYDYVMLVCRYDTDYNELLRKLGLEGKKVPITKKRSIRARAIWYDKVSRQILYPEDVEDSTSEEEPENG